MVARDLCALLESAGDTVHAPPHGELDITNRDSVARVIASSRPDVIVNCAAFTKVDDCETESEKAFAVNGRAVAFLAEAANEAASLLVQISTDFVFDGRSRSPYEPADPARPLSAYGSSKLEGERAAATAAEHLVVRTSWLFGRGGWNFVEAMRKQIDSGKKELRVVNDQRGRPTYTPHLARAVVDLASAARSTNGVRGVFHYADAPDCTWFEFAAAIVAELRSFGQLAHDVAVLPVTSAEFPRPAQRPAYSVLSTEKIEQVIGRPAESWRDGLREYLRAA